MLPAVGGALWDTDLLMSHPSDYASAGVQRAGGEGLRKQTHGGVRWLTFAFVSSWK